MQNDAKLGLLAGVAAVIVAAVVSGSRPSVPAGPPPRDGLPKAEKPAVAIAPAPRPARGAKPVAAEPVPAELPSELPSTPVARTRHEVEAIPTGGRPRR